ncbi:MAG: SRPBCC family protein [Elainellaceae cyanobacterium]
MATIERSIEIKAPVNQVFEYMDDPLHQPQITPSMTAVKDIERLSNGGTRSHYTYKMAGIPLKGTAEAIEYTPNERIVFQLSGGIDGKIWWLFGPVNSNNSRMTYRTEYTVPVPVLGEPLAKLATVFNEREVETKLANLKTVMEI